MRQQRPILGSGPSTICARFESNGRLDADVDAVSSRALSGACPAWAPWEAGIISPNLQAVEEVVDGDTAEAWGLYEGQLVAMIHSGSRGLGHQVCTDHVSHLERQFVSDDGGWRHEGYDWWIPDRQLAAAPRHSPEAEAYLGAMGAAANYAFANRAVLAQRLITALEAHTRSSVEWSTVYDVAHNIAKDEGTRH